MSATRPRPAITGSETGTGKGVAPFKRQVSPEGRQRLSELATRRHQQGGFQKSGDGNPKRPKTSSKKAAKRRVSARVAEAAREKKNAEAIIDVFKDGIHPNQPTSIRLKAAEAWIKVEQEDAKLRLKEEAEEGQRHDRAELLELLSNRLTSGHSALLLRKQLAERAGLDPDIIEGHISDEEAV
jgi:hypothetical protein